MPPQMRAATLVPSSFNEADNTIDVVWTTGARVRRYDWYSEIAYEEELAVTPEAVDMSRFDAGTVQVLDGHDTHSGVRAILGIAIRGSIESGEGRATLKLSTRPELAGIVADIRAGIIRAISFGYSISKYEITRAIDRTDGVNMPLYRAVLWQPNEISFVSVPADPDASTRSQPANGVPCEFITRAPAQSPTQQDPNMPMPGTQTGAQNDATNDSTRAATTPPAAPAMTTTPATMPCVPLPRRKLQPAPPKSPRCARATMSATWPQV
jgi:phage head maturation protease